MILEPQESAELSDSPAEDAGIISETVLEFSENSELNDGMCSCVCISDEQCCGCLLQ